MAGEFAGRSLSYSNPPFEERMAEWLARFGPPTGKDEAPGTAVPLTFSQAEMWYQYLLDTGDPIYNEFDAVRIWGPLDRGALEYALRRVAERHDAFRLRFSESASGPVMVYQEEASFPLRFIDVSGDPAALSEPFIHGWVRRIAREPMDLQAEPARATLLRLAPGEHLFVIMLHHIIKDGTSEGVILGDLSHFYTERVGGETRPLPAIEFGMGAYARWQQKLDSAGAFASQIKYWKRELKGVEPADVVGDFPRPAVLSTAGAKAGHTVAPDVVAKLRTLAHEEGASLFMLLSAAFALLIHRYTGKADVPVAFPIHNRMQSALPMIGCFINSVVFRARFGQDGSFRELLRRSRDTLARAYEHQDVPLARVVQKIKTVRRADQNPIAAASVMMRSPKWQKLQLPGCRTLRFDVDVKIAKFDLLLEYEEFPHGLFCKLEYRSSLYKPETARALLANLDELLTSIAAAPDQSFRTLTALSPEQQATLRTFEGTSIAAIPDTLTGMLGAQARTRPDAPALIEGDRSLTYGELDQAAHRMAGALQRLAGDVGTVAICADRSIETIAAILGVLEAGAAYLPLDPSYPIERLRFMLEDSNAHLLLCSRAKPLDLGTSLPVRYIEDLLGEAYESTGARSRAGDDATAYVMYTSGTSGTPNAVVVGCASVANYVVAFRDALALGHEDRLLQLASLSFDISVEEIFGALCSGASLAIPPPRIAHSIRALLEGCRERGITVLDLPTAYFHEMAVELAEQPDLMWPASIRAVVIGGEALRTKRASQFFSRVGSGVRLLNTYGPTETTVAVTFAEVSAQALAQEGTEVRVGRPIQNVRVHILDDALQPLPIGAIGRLFVSGSALARDYLHRRELTAERFLQDARFGRMFDTGDLARFGHDGMIELHGRSDDQLKIHGFRVEPEEIEALLLAHSDVREAAVVAVDGEMTACIVAASPNFDRHLLHAHLARQCPAYMIPAHFVPIDSVPLTINGKRDRAALQTIARASREIGDPSAARAASVPMTKTQARLAAIWEEFFGRSVGLHDDFFALGGYSLLAARIFARIEARMGRRLPLQQLFVRPTIAGLAEALSDEALHVSSFISLHESQRAGAPIFYLHGDNSGGALYTRDLARRLRLDHPLCVLAPHGGAGEPLPPSIDDIVEDYIGMIKSVRPRGPYIIGGHCTAGLIAIEIARRMQQRGDEITQVFALQPPSVHYALAPAVSILQSVAHFLNVPTEKTLYVQTMLKKAWRLLDRLTSRRRRATALRDLAYRLRGAAPPPPAPAVAWRDTYGFAQVVLADRFNPIRFDGELLVIKARDSFREMAEDVAWRRAARDVRIVETPGTHSTCFVQYQQDLADLLSRELAGGLSTAA